MWAGTIKARTRRRNTVGYVRSEEKKLNIYKELSHMRLFIAEKPSLGRAIAEAIGKPVKSDKLSIKMDNGDIICWSAGHILQPKLPEQMDEAYEAMESQTASYNPIRLGAVGRTQTQKDLIGQYRATAKTGGHGCQRRGR